MQRLALLLLASAVALTAVTGVGTLPFWISIFIYRPTPLVETNPAAWGLPAARVVDIRSGRSERLFGWWAPPPRATAPVALILHGRSANVSTRAPVAARLVADGWGVLLFDYRGYGRSTGRPDEAGLTQDATAAYDWLRDQGIAPGRILVIGQSLGGAPAARLGVLRPVRALALVSPFTSLPEALADRLALPFAAMPPWTRNRFDVGASVQAVRAPVLLIVSRDDGLVPYANSRKVAARARDLRWMEADGLRHDGLLSAVAASGRLSRALRALAARDPAAADPPDPDGQTTRPPT